MILYIYYILYFYIFHIPTVINQKLKLKSTHLPWHKEKSNSGEQI